MHGLFYRSMRNSVMRNIRGFKKNLRIWELGRVFPERRCPGSLLLWKSYVMAARFALTSALSEYMNTMRRPIK
jgi:hypothetical protein